MHNKIRAEVDFRSLFLEDENMNGKIRVQLLTLRLSIPSDPNHCIHKIF